MRKLIDNTGYIGFTMLAAGGFYYSVTNLWDWRVQVAVFGGLGLLLIYLVANLSRLRQVMAGRTGRQAGSALLTLVLGVGILGMLNFLNLRHHARVDLTENQEHALSEQTRRIASSLESDIEIIGFFPDEVQSLAFQDLAREYRFLTSRIRYQVIDPETHPGKAQEYGAGPGKVVFVVAGSKKEALADFDEQKITNALIKVTREGQKKIYFLEGHGERDLTDTSAEGYSQARSQIESQNYSVETFNLAQQNRIPSDAAVLVSAGPQVDFFPNEVELLGSYLAQGGKLLILADAQTDFSQQELLNQYGIRLRADVVIDVSLMGRFSNLGPAAPLVAGYADHPITQDLKTMSFFPMARSLEAVDSELDYETTDLLTTSERSWGETDLEGDSAAFDEGKDVAGPMTLGLSAVKSIPAPAREPAEAESEEGGAEGNSANRSQADAADGADENAPSRESRLVVIGDSDFAANSYFDRSASANGDLFLNAVSWLAEDVELLSIRPKDPTSRSITMTGSEQRLVFWGSVVFFPLATLIFGISVWYRRR